MRKHLLPLMLLVSPYGYLIYLYRIAQQPEITHHYLTVYGAMILLIFIPNMVYAIMLYKNGETSHFMLKWALALKLFNIPVYISIYLLSVVFVIIPLAFVFIIFMVVFDYILLLPSTFYLVSGIVKANREGSISSLKAVIYSFFSFFFCLDVIIAIVMYFTNKKYSV